MSFSEKSNDTWLEIALSIGKSLDITEMLESSLSAYCASLNCVGGEIYYLEKTPEEKCAYKKIHSFIQEDRRNIEYRPKLLNKTYTFVNAPFAKLKKGQSIKHVKNNYYFHIFNLPEFGILLLIREDTEFKPQEITKLISLNQRLAIACQGCWDHHQLQKSNNELEVIKNRLKNKNRSLKHSHKAMLKIMDDFRQSDKALREWDSKFRSVFENLEDVYFQVDENGILTFVSNSIKNYSGYSSTTIIEQPVENFFFDRNDYISLSKLLATNGQVLDYEIHLTNNNGKLIYAMATVQANYDSEGKPAGCEGSLTEICEWDFNAADILQSCERLKKNVSETGIDWTILKNEIAARKEIEDAFQITSLQNRQLMSNIPAVLISVDAHDRITFWNNAAQNTFGIQHKQVLGRPFPLCGIHWDWDTVVKSISRCLTENRAVNLRDFCYVPENSSEKYLDLTISPFSGDSLSEPGFLIFAENKA